MRATAHGPAGRTVPLPHRATGWRPTGWAAGLAWACTAGLAWAQAPAPTPPLAAATATVAQPDATRLDHGLRPRAIAPNTWVIEGAVADFGRANGCNIINTGFIATPAGVIVVNTGPGRLYGEQQRQAIARVTPLPVVRVLNLNLHPDYFFGNQAYGDVPTEALPGSIRGMRAEGQAYEDNLFRLCGDWMKGTESTPARQALQPGVFEWGGHRLELLRLSGHTDDDLVLIDHSTGVVFAGGLVFADRVPTTPHARLVDWQASLERLRQRASALPLRVMVPSHGPVHTDLRGLEQTRDWLQWLAHTLSDSARAGLDLGEVLALPIPPRFAGWAALPAEYVRSVTHLYPQHELAALRGQPAPGVTGR
ncbi:quinoprotein relay system zinc metallohydrolase 1 [Aquabacterium sp. A08]|uniref:quinoprotein relay system zinc metallohydrolase 1 n=1 Tax=Aquabacterium sp. A08 TaxID=2718532 RepID=UPI001421777A|nr:quinoprotein relay system zinc metallohydrolase 1 [Aquabacterium sp. A08]NIC40905.1 quinoprotein relay system zinc metallohydrolase 1 [Aquabacterium sp. A08]NIC43636.1 quinoprotein relay system zinc metallohydrolase 1 [Aquabacterium sp. A08]